MGSLNINEPISYLLQGQSNACDPEFSLNVPSDLRGPLDSCFIFENINNRWSTLQCGINSNNYPQGYMDWNNLINSYGNKFSIELRLGKLLRDYYSSQIYLFKYAWPGSGLQSSSQGGCWKSSLGTDLFFKSLQYYKTAKRDGGITNLSPSFLIWIQGESDSTAFSTYAAELTTWITATRSLYGSNLPIIIVSLSTGQTTLVAGNITGMKAAQKSLATTFYTASTDTFGTQSGGATIPNVYYIDQNEACYTFAGATIHYSAASLDNIASYVFKVVKNYILT